MTFLGSIRAPTSAEESPALSAPAFRSGCWNRGVGSGPPNRNCWKHSPRFAPRIWSMDEPTCAATPPRSLARSRPTIPPDGPVLGERQFPASGRDGASPIGTQRVDLTGSRKCESIRARPRGPCFCRDCPPRAPHSEPSALPPAPSTRRRSARRLRDLHIRSRFQAAGATSPRAGLQRFRVGRKSVARDPARFLTTRASGPASTPGAGPQDLFGN